MENRSLKNCVVLLLAISSLFAGGAVREPTEDVPNVRPSQGDRILVLAPHPDDETLGCGGIIQKAVALNLPVLVVFLTYGDDYEWSFLVFDKHPVFGSHAVEKMGMIRDGEARRAAAKLGLRPDQVTFLGYPDHALQSIWYDHWSGQPPAVGPLTRARQVPYSDAYRPGASYKGEDIVKDLQSILRDFRPTKIYLSHPADDHPDHLSLYLFARVALWDVKGDLDGPRLFPYLVHFSGWPEHKGLHETLKLDPAPPLRDDIPWLSESLDEREVATKLEALRQHKSQYEVGAPFLDAFVRENELFGDFPELVPGRKSADPEARHIEIREGRLVITFDTLPADIEKTPLSFGAFGYRREVPFAEMPKLRVGISGRDHEVFDRGSKLDSATVEVRREHAQLIVTLPLRVLGNPVKVLLGTPTPLLARPVRYFSWRVIILPQAGLGTERSALSERIPP